jgi:predicted RNA-binding protein YlqC (UPF0109 family)
MQDFIHDQAISTELWELTKLVRPKLEVFFAKEGIIPIIHFIYLTDHKGPNGNDQVQVNIHSSHPGAVIGKGGERAAALCEYLSTMFQKTFYVNAAVNRFDPFAPVYSWEV